MQKKGVTISDIAKKTGYSKTAVSFAFNWPNRIGEKAVQKILQCAKDLGYKGKSDVYTETERYKTICVLVPETLDCSSNAPIWALPTLCLYYLCEKNDFMLSIISDAHFKDSYFAKYSAVDAFLNFGLETEIDKDFLEIAKRRNIPVITVNTDLTNIPETEHRSLLEKRTTECVNMVFDIVKNGEINKEASQDSYLLFEY